jgi:hypothetical protein
MDKREPKKNETVKAKEYMMDGLWHVARGQGTNYLGYQIMRGN